MCDTSDSDVMKGTCDTDHDLMKYMCDTSDSDVMKGTCDTAPDVMKRTCDTSDPDVIKVHMTQTLTLRQVT